MECCLLSAYPYSKSAAAIKSHQQQNRGAGRAAKPKRLQMQLARDPPAAGEQLNNQLRTAILTIPNHTYRIEQRV